jgi:ketol-acid reductoisomerase
VQQRNVAVLGSGGQALAQALSLRDSGVDVRGGIPESAASREAWDAEGLRILAPYAACEEADLVVLLAPSAVQQAVYTDAVRPNLVRGDALLFCDGLAVHAGLVAPPSEVDVCLVAPQAPASTLRREFESGRGVPVLVAVEQDASGGAWALALSYARAIGGTRAGALRTTFAEAAHVAVFASALAGGVDAVARAGFETLLEAGYQPEVAYLQCFSALRQGTDPAAPQTGQVARAAPQLTEFTRLLAGQRLVDAAVRDQLRKLLAETVDGNVVRSYLGDLGAGAPLASRLRSGVLRGPSATTGRDVGALLDWHEAPAGTDDRWAGGAAEDGELEAWLS